MTENDVETAFQRASKLVTEAGIEDDANKISMISSLVNLFLLAVEQKAQAQPSFLEAAATHNGPKLVK